ncbi:hypothetical protein LUD75_05780 [Epilithonimonas sp. JDS]|uniref:hypothetical protein n=1 Tax=Epilithonimonas sp. JDS TaxID=2902797 RepID=UPI001E5918F3|nr:hypothetical protein [Epilithonimonas sp. JDS]MCD9854203.1 hypothetical protein [Epilithonimonas sp. JDS]
MSHYLFHIKKIILLLFVMTASFWEAQILKYHYDKEMTFLSEADSLSGISVRFNSEDQSVPVYSIDFDSEKRYIRNTINFYYSYRKNMYKMDGILYNKKYAAANGFRTYSAESPVRTFKKATDTLYGYRTFKDLEKRIATDKDGTKIEIFVANLKDQIDYSEPALFYLSEHYGISPGLGKGEIVVYANYIFNKNSSSASFVKLKDINEDIYFKKEQIEYLIDDKYRDFYKKVETEEMPMYCSVTSFGKDVDEKTGEEINDLLGNVCEYFTLWRNYETNEQFKKYYNAEVNRRVEIYKKNGNLSEKQLKVYIAEVNQLKTQNSKENFDYQ